MRRLKVLPKVVYSVEPSLAITLPSLMYRVEMADKLKLIDATIAVFVSLIRTRHLLPLETPTTEPTHVVRRPTEGLAVKRKERAIQGIA